MLQITLVPDKHNNDVGVCVVAQFFEPASDIDISGVLGDIVYQECTDSPTIVPVEEGKVSNRIVQYKIEWDGGSIIA